MTRNFLSHLNQYRSMWVLVFFDLPTNTKKERRAANHFRKELLRDGFTMFQYSIYMRFSASRENANVHSRRVKSNLPKNGHVGILTITDKQFAMMELFISQRQIETKKPSQQLELF